MLEAACGRAGACDAGAVFVGGESGVGKTRLMAEFERVALAAGARFLVGGCVDVGGSELPYAPLLGALRTLVQDTERHVLEEMAGPGRGELGRLVPELAVPETGIGMADPLAQSRLFEGLLGLFARAGREEPVVLVIEDLHWADPSTRGFLSFLVRNMRRERLLLVATYRDDELHRRHPLRQFLAEVERLPTVELPTLVVCGTEDGLFGSQQGSVFRELMPNCSSVLLYGAAHELGWDRPQALAALVGDFARRHEAFVVTRA